MQSMMMKKMIRVQKQTHTKKGGTEAFFFFCRRRRRRLVTHHTKVLPLFHRDTNAPALYVLLPSTQTIHHRIRVP